MPVYFFTQAHLLNNNQSANNKFGPVAGDPEQQNRVCSLHTFSNDSKAFSVVKGDIRMQPVAGSTTLINLVLKPEPAGTHFSAAHRKYLSVVPDNDDRDGKIVSNYLRIRFKQVSYRGINVMRTCALAISKL